jgi:hypothetical protein
MAALEKADPATRAAALPALDRALLDLVIDQDTFEVLYRRRLQLAIPDQLDVHDDAEADAPTSADAVAATRGGSRPRTRAFSLGDGIGIVLAALAALDLLLAARLGRRRGDR